MFKKKASSKYLLVFKTSSRCLQDMSWRRLQYVFSETIFRFQDVLEDEKLLRWRRLEDVLKTSWRHVLKTSWRHVLKMSWRHVLKTSWRHVLKTSWRHILKTSSRRLGGKQNFYWWYLYLTNLNAYLTNLCFTNLYLANLRRIQNASLRTQ